MRVAYALAVGGLLGLLAGCQTAPEDEPPFAEPVVQPQAFNPIRYTVPLQLESGPYPNLFDSASTATWVVTQRYLPPRPEGVESDPLPEPPPLPEASPTARQLSAVSTVIECDLQSVFGDLSVAYDAVGLRGMNVYLELPNGERRQPAHVAPDPGLAEQREGALRRFIRTNYVIFEEQPLVVPVSPGEITRVKLVFEGYGCRFVAQWEGYAPAMAEGIRPAEAWAATRRAVRKVRIEAEALSHEFD